MAQFERRYIAEYCADKWPKGGYQLNYPLGRIPERAVAELGYEAAAKLLRPWRPEVDAVKFFDTRIFLIETKVAKHWHVLGQLLMYAHLVPFTEELRPWWGKPVELRLVMPDAPPLVIENAEALGIQVDLYVTEHVLEHRKKYDVYTTREYRTARELKLATRRALGVE